MGNSHSHVFSWHRGTRIICKIWPLSEITQPEIGLILFQGTSPTSPNHYKWNKECGSQWGHGMSYGQNDPSPKKSSQNFRITFRLMGLRTPGGKGFRPHFSFGLGFLDPKTPTALLKQQSTTFCVDSQIKLIHPKWKLDNHCYGYPPPKPRYPTSGKSKIIFKHTLQWEYLISQEGKIIIQPYISKKARGRAILLPKKHHTRESFWGFKIHLLLLLKWFYSKKPWSIWDFPGSQLGNTTNLRCQHDGLPKVLEANRQTFTLQGMWRPHIPPDNPKVDITDSKVAW